MAVKQATNPQVPVPQYQFTEDDVKDPVQLTLKINKAFADYSQILTQLVRASSNTPTP
jgi:hypothetical protein